MPSPYVVGYTAPDAADLQRQQMLAQLLREQSMAPMGPTESFGGYAVKRSPLEGVAKVLMAYKAKEQQAEADATRKAIQQAGVQDVGKFIALLRGEPGAELPADVQGPTKPATPPDQGAALQLALGSQNPMLQQAGGALLQGMMTQQKPKWEKYEMPDGKGGMVSGFVDVNAPNPVATFQRGGAQPAKLDAVNRGGSTVFVNPYAPGGEVAHTMSPADQANLDWKQFEFNNLSLPQRYNLGTQATGVNNEALRIAYETGQKPSTAPVPSLYSSVPPAAGGPGIRMGGMQVPPMATPPAAAPVVPPISPAAAALGQGGQALAKPGPGPSQKTPLIQQPDTLVPPKVKLQLREAQPQEEVKLGSTLDSLSRLDRAAALLSEHQGLPKIVGPLGQKESVFGVPLDLTADARDARALQTSMESQAMQGALQAMRDASKTGGAVGNVTEKEWPILQQSFAALARAQTPKSYKQALDDLRAQVQASMSRIREAYESTYGQAKWKPPSFTQPTPSRATPNAGMPAGMPGMDAIEAELRRRAGGGASGQF